jgi:hypothetical protein
LSPPILPARTSLRHLTSERKPRIKLVRSALAWAALLAAFPAAAWAQAPPVNDNYLESLRLNEDGTRLERRDTLRDVRDTTNATVQSDIFNPPRSGGPAEKTTCGATSYGKTVWYDAYPDVNGVFRLRANGYDTVISITEFNRDTAIPSAFERAQCVNESNSSSEEFLVSVRRRRAYTIQIGGVNNAFGNLEFLFDFLADTDADGVLDDVDRCDRFAGTRSNSGCPPRLRANALIRAQPTADGIRLVSLRIDATRRSRVAVTCPGCGRQVKQARTVGFPGLRGRTFRAGSRIVIRVTRRRSIGRYIAYRILRGNFKKTERCMNPGSTRPRRRCG